MQNTLQAEGFDDEAALDETIKKLELDVKRSRKKEADGQDDAAVSIAHHYHRWLLLSNTRLQDEPSFPLIDVPDADVSHTLINRDTASIFPFL